MRSPDFAQWEILLEWNSLIIMGNQFCTFLFEIVILISRKLQGVQDMKTIVMGILAHVDAGKTTLSEAMLYESGVIRSIGRVDKGNTYLERDEQERERGITIFSKQAVLPVHEDRLILLDTPGHVDFSAEAERTLQVLDLAVLVVSAADGVQGHTMTLWKLLSRYHIPVFLFVNKLDQPGTDADAVFKELQERLSEECVDFRLPHGEAFMESVAMCGEEAMEQYLQTGEVSREKIARLIRERKLFPCFFGSALKMEGVKELLEGIDTYGEPADYHTEFGARVYKITRDPQGSRLTHMKITGGQLPVKTVITGKNRQQEEWQEKVNQIRCYNGEKFELADCVQAGTICTVTGLSQTYIGQGLGVEKEQTHPLLEPVMSYRVLPEDEARMNAVIEKLHLLEEEDPLLQVKWNSPTKELTAHVMGPVQIEILERIMKERYDIAVTFGKGRILYKETMAENAQPVEGVGHYEPLRHYAEVHLLLQPGEPGSGFVCDTDCSEDELDRNWQRLVLTHLMEKEYRGVLLGAPVTDIHVTLKSGRAHQKHTEGGDFRQATYRAVRQGLMQAESMLLEPYYDFQLEVPSGMIGRALTDIQRMNGEAGTPQTEGEMTTIEGYAPVAGMRDYQMEVNSYTRGQGHLTCTFRGYEPCQNAEAVIEEIGYDPERDIENPTGSVFCSHGAGFNVSWDKVPEYMHLENQLEKERALEEAKRQSEQAARQMPRAARTPKVYSKAEEKELEEIFIRTYGKVERKGGLRPQTYESDYAKKQRKKEEAMQEYLLVDGYNVIFAWEELKELAKVSIEAARDKLMDILCNYQGYKKCVLILVFDAYKVEGYALEIQKYHNIHVVYTKEAETADQYIEKVVHHIGRKYHVTVVTSDGVEQVITMGQGGTRISSRDFLEEIEYTRKLIEEDTEKQRVSDRNYLFDHADEEFVKKMEKIRLGKNPEE